MGPLETRLPYVNIVDTQATLADVIEEGQWRLQRLYTELPIEDKEQLILIEPTPKAQCDAWTWKENSTGCYTVRDAYGWLNARGRVVAGNTGWSWIWKLKVPEKIRLFVWRVLQGAVQTNEKRFSCHLTDSPTCTRCSAQVEDRLHCLRDCPHSRELWLKLGAHSWPGFNGTDVVAWMTRMARGGHISKFLAGVWGVWRWRNNMCMEESPWTIHEAWRRLCVEHDEINLCMEQGDEREGLLLPRWNPPACGEVKLNIDGSFRDLEGVMGCGGILRDHHGVWMSGFMAMVRDGSALMAESRALRGGLQLAWARGHRKLQCETDSRELVCLLEARQDLQLFPVAAEIVELMG